MPREVWESIHGKKPDKMQICHKCDNKFGACCNPDHLFLGTPKENCQDREIKGRSGTKEERINRVKRGIETSKRNGTFYEAKRKTAETMKKNNSYEKSAIKCQETKIKNGTTSKGFTSEMAKKAWQTKIKKGVAQEVIKKGWETRRLKKGLNDV